MKIDIRDINPVADVTVTGNEPWLATIYAAFPHGTAPKPLVTGALRLTREEGGSVQVDGRLDYTPFVGCGRCALPLPWPLALEISVRFYPEDVNPAPKEKNLSSADLDAYYLENDEVDLEQVVYDAVHTELPSQPLITNDDGDSCAVCKRDLTSEQVYGESPKTDDGDKPESPFAALKGLKIRN